MRAAAVKAVLARARAVVGASKKETQRVSDSLSRTLDGELNIEQTFDNIIDKTHPHADDIILDFKKQKRFDCALMLDTSLSMTGKKLALLAVAATVLAYRLPPEDFAIVSFESTATTLKRMRSKMPLEQIAAKILEVPAMGYTNIEAGLKEGLSQLGLGRHKHRIAILISDGKYTAGSDPIPVAARFRRLNVVMVGDFNTDPDAARAIADSGRGRIYTAQDFQNLPRTLHRLLSDLLA